MRMFYVKSYQEPEDENCRNVIKIQISNVAPWCNLIPKMIRVVCTKQGKSARGTFSGKLEQFGNIPCATVPANSLIKQTSHVTLYLNQDLGRLNTDINSARFVDTLGRSV